MAESRDNTSPWYAAGLRFECQRCGRCCRGEPGYVWVSQADLARMAAFLGREEGEFTAAVARRIGRRFSLRERPNGDCILYQPGLGCSVYPVRPRQCRTFPFWPENLRSRRRWEALGRECPGIGRGRTWSRREVELLAGRRRPTPTAPGRSSPALRRALRSLVRIYHRLDEVLAPWQFHCSACGRCCDFSTHHHILYVTELERALLELRYGAVPEVGVEGRCPFLVGQQCGVREVRPIGCRTFFCQPEAAEAGRHWHEWARRKLAPLRESSGLTIHYAPLLEAIRTTR